MLTTFGNKSKPASKTAVRGSGFLSAEEQTILLESLDGSIRVDGNRYKTTWNYGQSTFEALKKSLENNTLKPASERDKNAAFFTRLPEAGATRTDSYHLPISPQQDTIVTITYEPLQRPRL